MISKFFGDLFRNEVVPRVKFLREMAEQFTLIEESGSRDSIFNTQRLFKVDDGCVCWWVAATTEVEAVEEVLKYEKTSGCDLFEDGYWDLYDIDGLAREIYYEEAKKTTFFCDNYGKSNMWDEFIKDPSTKVIACSEF